MNVMFKNKLSNKMKSCPKVCHDELVCEKDKHGKKKSTCHRDKGCDPCKKKKKCKKEVKRPCELPCKLKDQIKVLEVKSRSCQSCFYGCQPKIYDPVKMVQKCNYVCCNSNCQACEGCWSEKSCSDHKCESSSSSSSSCSCILVKHKPTKCESSSSSSSSSSDDHKKSKHHHKGGCKTCHS